MRLVFISSADNVVGALPERFQMTVNQLLAAINHLGLNGDSEIVVRSIDGTALHSNVEICDDGMVIRAMVNLDEIEEIEERDCYCGEFNCHYCGG